MDLVKRIWYLSPMRAAKVQASLRIRAVSPEPSLLAHTNSESRGTFRQKARSLAPLNGWACAVKICHDRMLEDTNSLVGAHICITFFWNCIYYYKLWRPWTDAVLCGIWSGLCYSLRYKRVNSDFKYGVVWCTLRVLSPHLFNVILLNHSDSTCVYCGLTTFLYCSLTIACTALYWWICKSQKSG